MRSVNKDHGDIKNHLDLLDHKYLALTENLNKLIKHCDRNKENISTNASPGVIQNRLINK